MKVPTSHRLTPEVKALLVKMAEKLSISETAVLVLAIREKAKREGVTQKERNGE